MSEQHENANEDTNDHEAYDSGDDDETPKGKGDRPPQKRAGRRKINIEFIKDKSRRHITFSKRKAGIMKKAYELSTLTGTQVLLLVASETGHVYTFATPKLQPLITKTEGKNLIQACLNAPDPQPMGPDSQDASQDMNSPMPQGVPQQYGQALDMEDKKRDIKSLPISGYGQQQLPQQQMSGHNPTSPPYNMQGHPSQLPSMPNQGGMHNQYNSLDMPSPMYGMAPNDYPSQGGLLNNVGMGGGMPNRMMHGMGGGSQYSGGGGSNYGLGNGQGLGGLESNPHKVTIYGNQGAMRGGQGHQGLQDQYGDYKQ